MRPSYRVWWSAVVMVSLSAGSPELRAQLRVDSQVEVTAHRQRDAGFVTSLMVNVLPFHLAVGKASVVTVVAGGEVRVEGLGPVLGLAPDVVLLSRPTGETVFLLPASRTYFRTHLAIPAAIAEGFGSTLNVRSKRRSDTILGYQTERVLEDLKVTPGKGANQDPNYATDRFGRRVEAWTLDETPEQRTARFLRRETNPRELWKEMPITIESWLSDGLGADGTAAAESAASIGALSTAGLAVLPARRFALRQIITNPTGGYRVESRVTALAPIAVGDDTFQIPAGYAEIPAPRLLRLSAR